MIHDQKPTVAVINDDATQRATLAGLLEAAGYRVLEFAGAEESLATLTTTPPELIITDLHMPGLDGWRFCRLLRSPEYSVFNQIPILVVSATFSGDEPDRITAGMGANAFMPSPVNGPRFTDLARQLIAGHVPPVAPRVLVVEDDPDFADLLSQAFATHGCHVTVAHTARVARDRFRDSCPDTVVLDYHLPDLNGDCLLQEIQSLESAPAVVMITGDVNPELALRFVKMGPRAYAHKPFDVEYLIRLCDSAWRERCLLRVQDLLEHRTRELRESDERFRVMADHAPTMMILLDAEGRVHQLNRAALDFAGCEIEGALGLGLGHGLNCVHAKEDSDGCGAGVECHTCPICSLVRQVLESGQSSQRVEVGLKVISKGHPTDVVLLASAARVEVSGQPMALLYLEDVSALRRLEEQLRQAQKMEAIGQLAGGVAHDFNNILAAMLLQLGLLRLDANLTPDLAAALGQLEKGANRAAGLTRQLLTFSRRQLMKVKPLDLNELLADLLKMLRRLLGEHIDLMVQGETGPLWIEADAGMVEQVVMNLCVNARDAMPQGGRLTIKTESRTFETADAETRPEAQPGKFVCLTVADTGCGMDEATQARIFEPFFTTKDIGKGTGLGLATAYGIVRQHLGWIEVESKVGQGSMFRVFLPAQRMPPSGSPARSSPEAPLAPRGRETILVVEDEESVRRLAVSCLQRLGYRVLEASNGVEALQRWNEVAGRIDLLLTDKVMPEGINGLELAERLRAMNRRLKVIISSGYSLELTRPTTWSERGVKFLAKPYEFETLAVMVRKCLDGW
jgi:CheY-like chemotaxis protein